MKKKSSHKLIMMLQFAYLSITVPRLISEQPDDFLVLTSYRQIHKMSVINNDLVSQQIFDRYWLCTARQELTCVSSKLTAGKGLLAYNNGVVIDRNNKSSWYIKPYQKRDGNYSCINCTTFFIARKLVLAIPVPTSYLSTKYCFEEKGLQRSINWQSHFV